MASEGKTQFTCTINSELMGWVDENVKGRRFSSRSHACEYALARLKGDSDGSLYRLSELWGEGGSGEPCYPCIVSAKDVGRLLLPEFDSVEKPIELGGWILYPPFSTYFRYRYERDIGPFWLVLETDKGQKRLEATLSYKDRPFSHGGYNLVTGRWVVNKMDIDNRNIATLEDFAREFVRFAERLRDIYEQK